MGFLVVILTLALIGLVAAVVSAPVRRVRSARDAGGVVDAPMRPGVAPGSPPAHKRDEMEAAREAKYREIRDTELDFRTGKLSPEDYQTIDADLRAEAIEILNELESTEAPTAAGSSPVVRSSPVAGSSPAAEASPAPDAPAASPDGEAPLRPRDA